MAISEKLMRIQTQIKAPKNLYNSFGKYKYRNAEGICEAVKPYLAQEKCALTLSDDVIAVGNRIYIKAIATLTDNETGETYTASAMAREAEEKKGMDESQITGTASSYARKYALNGMFLLDDTKDADSDEHHVEAEEKAKQVNAGKELITETQRNALTQRCMDAMVDTNKVCELYKVKGLEFLTQTMHSNINLNWEKVVERCKANY